jgi:uncharacterized protein (DUF427 family)
MKAIWNNVTIAESNQTVVVEGNHYFPPDSVRSEFLTQSERKTICPWKGIASYYNIEINGSTNANAAWYYPNPKDAAKKITGHVAFYKELGIKIEP